MGKRTGGVLEETGRQRGAAGADRDLKSRSRVARQRLHDRGWRPEGVDAFLSRWSKTRMRLESWVKIVV